MNEKHDVKQIFDQHLRSLRFQAASRQTVVDRALGKEEPVMKKKTSVALVFAIIVTLLAATALAAVAVMHSDTANKINLSREALYEKYGLTPQTLGLFVYKGGQENDEYQLAWTCDTYHPSLTGIYTTVVKDGAATAEWSYDGVDPSVYDSGDLSAPVWGHKQLEAAQKDPEEASEYSHALYQQDEENGVSEAPETTPKPLKEGERYWKDDEIVRPAEPGANDVTAEQAFGIAVQALAEDFGMDPESITEGWIEDESFLLRDNGETLWEITVYVTQDGVEQECIVSLDGATGEVLSSDVFTGGNG